MWKSGAIRGYQTEKGTIIVTEELGEQPGLEKVVVVYAR